MEQPQDHLLNVLSVCTALSINGVSRNDAPNAINAIAGVLDLNLSAYWQPTRESYLNHVSKDRIVAVVSAVVSPEEGKRLAKMKKGETAEAAEKLLTVERTGCPSSYPLPKFIRSAITPTTQATNRTTTPSRGVSRKRPTLPRSPMT